MGSGKRDIKALLFICIVVGLCVYCMYGSYMKDRESRNKTDAIHIKIEKPVVEIEMPDDSMETLKEYIEKLKEGAFKNE